MRLTKFETNTNFKFQKFQTYHLGIFMVLKVYDILKFYIGYCFAFLISCFGFPVYPGLEVPNV
jgi:hypothetical protein